MSDESGRAQTYDCQRCGACCYNPHDNRVEGFLEWVQVREGDPMLDPQHDELRRRLTYTNEKGEVHLLLTAHEQRCVALAGKLGHDVRCTAYEARPAPCRAMEPGGERCLEIRKEWRIGEPPRGYRRAK